VGFANMAIVPENSFEKVLERFRDSLTEEQKRQFSATSFQDVESEIQNIQCRYGSEKKLRNLKKLSKFLEAMNQVEQVVKVFLNVHEVVAFVWVSGHGPSKATISLRLLIC
jgi:transcriptional/translational regulatory protein YebC/TACO1